MGSKKPKIGISVISLAHPLSMILGEPIKIRKELLDTLSLDGVQFFPLRGLSLKGVNVLAIEGPRAEKASDHKGLGKLITGDYHKANYRTSKAILQYPDALVVDFLHEKKHLIETANLPGRFVWDLVGYKKVCLNLMHVFEYHFGRDEITSGKVRPEANGHTDDNIRALTEYADIGLVQIQARRLEDLENFIDCHGYLYHAFKFFLEKSHEFGKPIPDIIFELQPRCVRYFWGLGPLNKSLIIKAQKQVKDLNRIVRIKVKLEAGRKRFCKPS